MRIREEEVQLYVGPEKTRFPVSRYLLCQKIPYFEKMFQGDRFVEAQTGVAFFPEDSPEAFDLLIQWVHGYGVREMHRSKQEDCQNDWKCVSYDAEAFYCLAEKLCLPKLQNLIMIALQSWDREHGTEYPVERMVKVYERTQNGSPLRRYASRSCYYAFVDRRAEEGGEWLMDAMVEKCRGNADLLGDILTLSIRQSVRKDLDQGVMASDLHYCEFHCHIRDSLCYPGYYRELIESHPWHWGVRP
jgi:hypothetical protein